MQIKTITYTLLLSGCLVGAGYLIGSLQTGNDIQDIQSNSSGVTRENDRGEAAIDELNARMLRLEQQLSADRQELQEQMTLLQETMQIYLESGSSSKNSIAIASAPEVEDAQQDAQGMMSEISLAEHIAEQDFHQREELARVLDAEEADSEWSGRAESEIRMSIDSSESLNAQITLVECRSTYCRIDGVFGDTDARNQLIAQLMALMPWETEAFYQGAAEGDGTGALYILKEGASQQSDGV
jgi:hypothetical protein